MRETNEKCPVSALDSPLARALTRKPIILKMNHAMTREELIALAKKIVAVQGTEEELDAWCEQFDENVPHPAGSSLFFWPENYNGRKDDISQYNPTVEEVVDIVLSYQPRVSLPPQSGD